MLTVLDLDPMLQSTGAAWSVAMLWTPSLAILCCRQRGIDPGPISPCSKSLGEIPSGRRTARLAWRIDSCSLRNAALGEDVEGAEPHLVVVLAAVQCIEIGYTIDAKHHRPRRQVLLPYLASRLDYPRAYRSVQL